MLATTAAEQVAEALLRIGAVQLRPREPFRFASGMLSPIYTDNRLLCSSVTERRLVSTLFAETLTKRHIPADVIAGAATAGIPHAAWLAERLNLPMVYVRASAKDHGTGRRVEGRVLPGQRAIVLEDMFSTGASAIQTIQALREETNAVVTHCLGICTYGFAKADAAFAAVGVTPIVLTDFETIVRVAVRHGYIAADQQEQVVDWAREPASWATRVGLA